MNKIIEVANELAAEHELHILRLDMVLLGDGRIRGALYLGHRGDTIIRTYYNIYDDGTYTIEDIYKGGYTTR